ncbi:MAG: hypothetical protein ACRC0L_02190 [Angustibacter sp.]
MEDSTAFFDESQSHAAVDPDVYILAATIVLESVKGEARAAMTALARRGQGKLHWRQESDHRRRIITRAITALPVRHVVVVQLCHPSARPERRRRICLERMLYEVDGLIAAAVLESRGARDDARDQVLIQSSYDSKKISFRPHIAHERGRDEPLLWIPDAVCGLVSRARTGTPEYLNTMASSGKITVVTSS